MTDARWLDVDDDAAAAVEHFSNALTLHQIGKFDQTGIEGYRDQMALMHAMQSGHTSAEAALVRILSILDEEKPSGEDWHHKLITRLARPVEGDHQRPALLPPEVAADLDETGVPASSHAFLREIRGNAIWAFAGGSTSPDNQSARGHRKVSCDYRSDVAV